MDDIAYSEYRALADKLSAANAKSRELSSTIDRLRYDNARLAKELEEARAKHFEEAAQIADAEPEFEEEPSPEIIEAMVAVGPVNNARAACSVTKKSIAAAIRHKATVTTDDLPEGGSET